MAWDRRWVNVLPFSAVLTKFRPQAMPLSAEPVSRIRNRSVRFEGLCSIAATLRRHAPRWRRVARTGSD
jgi:hypothetical protein